jgi:hypothetical protein
LRFLSFAEIRKVFHDNVKSISRKDAKTQRKSVPVCHPEERRIAQEIPCLKSPIFVAFHVRSFVPQNDKNVYFLVFYDYFFQELIPLSVPVFCAEPRHKRISTSIGAKNPSFHKEVFVFFVISTEEKSSQVTP